MGQLDRKERVKSVREQPRTPGSWLVQEGQAGLRVEMEEGRRVFQVYGTAYAKAWTNPQEKAAFGPLWMGVGSGLGDQGETFNGSNHLCTGSHPEECLSQGSFNPAKYMCPSPGSGFPITG